jgi:hypothetical protein
MMTALIQAQHDLSPIEIDAIEECIYNYNRRATGHSQGAGGTWSRSRGTAKSRKALTLSGNRRWSG